MSTSKIFSVKKGFAQILILGVVLAMLVLATSIYLKQTQKLPNIPSQITTSNKTTPKPSPSPVTQSYETANWKTFAYVYNLFNFKYPNIWVFEENNTRGDGIWFNFFPVDVTPDHTTNSHFGNETLRFIVYDAAKFDNLKSTQITSTTIAGQPALVNDTSYDIFIKKLSNGNDWILHLEFNKDSKPYINSFLSTLKFYIPESGNIGF